MIKRRVGDIGRHTPRVLPFAHEANALQQHQPAQQMRVIAKSRFGPSDRLIFGAGCVKQMIARGRRLPGKFGIGADARGKVHKRLRVICSQAGIRAAGSNDEGV